MSSPPRHPLQRLSSPAPGASLAWHLLGLLSFAQSFHFLSSWETPMSRAYGGHFQFLTIIALALSLVVFAAAAAADLLFFSFFPLPPGLGPALFALKNRLASVALPLDLVVTALYFGISAVDRDLVSPPEFKIPLGADLGFHLAPAVLLAVDFLLLSPPWVVSAPAVMAVSTAVAFGYWYWVEYCYSRNGWYVYPIFALLNTTQRILLFTFSAILVTISSSALKIIYATLNGSSNPTATKKTN